VQIAPGRVPAPTGYSGGGADVHGSKRSGQRGLKRSQAAARRAPAPTRRWRADAVCRVRSGSRRAARGCTGAAAVEDVANRTGFDDPPAYITATDRRCRR
jgi:hypothetical protein